MRPEPAKGTWCGLCALRLSKGIDLLDDLVLLPAWTLCAVLGGVKAEPCGWQCRGVNGFGWALRRTRDWVSRTAWRGWEGGGAPVKRGLSRSHFP